jgi:hypothetical protein
MFVEYTALKITDSLISLGFSIFAREYGNRRQNIAEISIPLWESSFCRVK